MKKIVIIPARYASTRLPGKPLVDINGQTMIERVYRQALKADVDDVMIATDDQRILTAMQALDFNVCMTDANHQSGTDRLAEVVASQGYAEQDIIINVQGDEPLIPPATINQVADLLANNADAVMSTLSTKITDEQALHNPNVVKVISNKLGQAMYFTRAGVPYNRDAAIKGEPMLNELCQRHIGIYAYRAGFLATYANWPAAPLEKVESLEQLRVLYQGKIIQVAEAIEVPPEGVDTPEDLNHVRALLANPLGD